LYYENNNNSPLPFLPTSKGKKNGKKSYGKQNYLYKIAPTNLLATTLCKSKRGHLELIRRILLMLVRGVGIRDIAKIERISIKKL